MNTKQECIKCHLSKPLEDFRKTKRRVCGRTTVCKLCLNAYGRDFYKKTPPRAVSQIPKKCTRCGKVKSFKEFVAHKASSDGLSSNCRSCSGSIIKAHYFRTSIVTKRYDRNATPEERRKKQLKYFQGKVRDHKQFLNELKDSEPCSDCKERFPSVCMDFDHVETGKRYSLAQMSNHSRERIWEELRRCELVCCNCHRVRTKKRRPPPKGISMPCMRRKYEAFVFMMQELKSKPCMDCVKCFPVEAMDFDHVRGKKVKEIGFMWSWNRDRLKEELAKCELVCANCHRLRTEMRRGAKAA